MSGAGQALRGAAVFLAVSAFFASLGSSYHVVPTRDGVWRGVLDPPDTSRLAVAAALGLLALVAERRRPRLLGPLAVLGLAAAPLVPVATGHAVPLLLFQGLGLLFVAGPAAALALREIVPKPRASWHPALAFGLAAAAFLAIGTRLPGPAGAQGDEPHYLTMAESLRSDGDLDLRDEFRRREYRAFYPGDLGAHTSPASPRGKLYTIHAPGLAALILPAFALGGADAARAFLALLAAATAALVFALTRRVLRDEIAARWAFAALALQAPFALYANQVYPEVPAALACAAFLVTTRSDGTPRLLLAAGAVAGALVWLHPKFLPLALCGLLLTVLRRGPVPWRAASLLVFATGLATLLLWMNDTYGVASLGAAYGRGVSEDLQIAHLPRGLLGLLLDREFGLLWLAPAWALLVAGFRPLWPDRPGDLMRGLLLAGPVVGVGAAYSMWWGGSCPPGRFLVPALPAMALIAAPGLRRRPGLASGLLGFGAAVLAVAVLEPRALHNRADGEGALLRVIAPALRLDQALPSFVGEDVAWDPGAALGIDRRGAPLRALREWDGTNVSSAAGAFHPERLVIPLLDGAPWRLAAEDTRGTPRIALPPGSYQVRVRGEIEDGTTGRLASLVVTLDEQDAARAFLGSDERAPVITLDLPEGTRRLEVWATGVRAGAKLTAIDVVPRRVEPRSRRRGSAQGS